MMECPKCHNKERFCVDVVGVAVFDQEEDSLDKIEELHIDSSGRACCTECDYDGKVSEFESKEGGQEGVSVKDFTELIQFLLSRPIEDFAKMYQAIGFRSEEYAQEKWQRARNFFPAWWCDLDEETQTKVLSYVREFYHGK